MINVTLVTRPHFPGSTSSLRYDCERIIAAALLVGNLGDKAKKVPFASSVHPATARRLGAADALVVVAASDIRMHDDDRITLSDMIHKAILAVHPDLRISVLLSFDLRVSNFNQREGRVFIAEREELRAQAIAQIVEQLQRLRAPRTQAS